MRPNKIREIWQAGGAVVNGWLAIPNSFSAETMAHQGWDSLTIDLQHGVVDYQTMVTMLQAISTTDTVPVVRVPWLEPGILMKALDAGAYGVICPMVNTRADAEKLVAYTHYAPRGTRSFGPVRALLYGGADYPQHANDTIVTFAMIETAEGMANLDAIAATPGLDGIYVGPADLTLSLTQGRLAPGFDREEPEMIAALHTILAACKKNGIRAALEDGGVVRHLPKRPDVSPKGIAEHLGQRRLPALQVAVAFLHFLVELRLQGVGPFGQRCAGQTAGEGGQINHGKAINEAKLRHWNHGTTFENPAASRRSRCSSRLSGFMTFSMALRFWAISSSL